MGTPIEDAGMALPQYNFLRSANERMMLLAQVIEAGGRHEQEFQDLYIRYGCKTELQPQGIILHPANDPKEIVRYFVETHFCEFRRSLNPDSSTYSWETEFMGIPLFIAASEVVDLTGSTLY